MTKVAGDKVVACKSNAHDEMDKHSTTFVRERLLLPLTSFYKSYGGGTRGEGGGGLKWKVGSKGGGGESSRKETIEGSNWNFEGGRKQGNWKKAF